MPELNYNKLYLMVAEKEHTTVKWERQVNIKAYETVCFFFK